MTKISTITFLLLITFLVHGQTDYGFGAGQIITKKGDTIKCFVELAVTYGNKVAYKKTQDSNEALIPTNEVKSILTPYKQWENIQVEKKEKLMSLMIDGKAKLFNHVVMNEGPRQAGSGGSYQMYQAPTVTYVILKSDSYVEIKKKDFKEKLGQVFADCPSVVSKINDKTYKFDDLEKVVTDYNNCQ